MFQIRYKRAKTSDQKRFKFILKMEKTTLRNLLAVYELYAAQKGEELTELTLIIEEELTFQLEQLLLES